MCGIAGMFSLDSKVTLDPRAIRGMSNAITHRGPDGEGLHECAGVALAHRRLAIIDLAGGHQPMTSSASDCVIVFNGEIYNYKELRAELDKSGVVLRTNSDTEVILEGWRIWGERILDRLRGMFAFAIYDKRDDRLVLARDHFGIKPLFYTFLVDGTLAFASELKALTALGSALSLTVRSDAVVDYFYLGYVPDSKCVFESVRKLPAAHVLSVSRGDANATPKSYWQPTFREPAKLSQEEVLTGTLEVLRESVRAHLVADVPVSSFLSGGLDSGLVTTLAASLSPDLLAHTMRFREGGFDESAMASLVARQARVDHRIHAADLPSTSDVVDIIAAYDEPYADSSCLPTFALCREVARDSKVALSGDGGDEMFGGYPWYMAHLLRAKLQGALPGVATAALGRAGRRVSSWGWPGILRPPGSGFLATLGSGRVNGLIASQGIVPQLDLPLLFTPDFLSAAGGPTLERLCEESHVFRVMERMEGGLRQGQSVDIHLYLPGDILTKVDRASMKCGLEVRVPFLDRAVFDWIAGLPEEAVLLGGQRKGLLKAMARLTLPAEVIQQPKKGFSVPIDDWMRGDLFAQLKERLASDRGVLWDVLDRRTVSRLVESHRNGSLRVGSFLFALFAFLVFLERVGPTRIRLS